MSWLDGALIGVALLTVLWWGCARGLRPDLLLGLSLAGLGLAGATLAAEGMRWQIVPWQLIALAAGFTAALSRWRPGRSRGWSRTLGRLGLVTAVLAGGLGLLAVRVPVLPHPSGPHRVGSEVFRWTDERRPETFSADPLDRREVVAQAWYPTEATLGQTVPYFEAQDRLPATIDGLPSWFFADFGEIDTHARLEPPISTERPTWPVLLFLPGWGSPREDYTGLITELASRGYVVVALSHPYESAVSLLADGRAVGQASNAGILGAQMADLSAIRAADSSFVLDQLGRMEESEPGSPLSGHLDLRHVGIVGHSLGGASAAQVLAGDARFRVGVNIDGTLFEALAGARLSAPFLWLQSDGQQQESYLRVRDQLLGGLRGGGDLIVVGGSSHQSFTDFQSYLSPVGRYLLGDADNSQSAFAATTGDVIAAFVGPVLAGPGDPLDQILARHPTVRLERRIAPASAQGPTRPAA